MSIFGGGAKSTAQTPTKAMGLDLQSAQYGAPIPVIFGQNKVAGNVVDYMDFQAIGHQQKQPGKGGGGGSSGTTYTYSSSYLLGLCEGPASIINVYDGSSVRSLSSVGGIGFTGTLGQAPWAHLSGLHAIGYSGTALAAFQNKDLGGSASLPNYNFEMAGRNQFGGGIVDANPADIVTAICTDTQIGINFNALGDLTQFKNYCTAAGIFFSPVYATQQTATQTLDDLFKYSNCAPFFSDGVLKVVPYGDTVITGNGVTFTPKVTAVADLGRDDFITNGPGDPVTVKRIGPADAMNIQRLEYKDRANTYHTSTVVASIDQDVVSTGARADQSDSVDMITTTPVARLVVQNLLQRTYYIRNTYEFQLPWRYCYLEPMDVVTLTDANTGLYLGPVRITEIGEDEHGLLSVVAEEFPDGVSHGGIYATQANSGATVDTNANPGAIDGPYLFRGPGFLVSNNQPEIWCALSGNDPMWAGCDVYLSHDGTSYTYLATHSRRASYGVLTNTLPSAADPDTTSAPNVVLNGPAQLLGGTQADADQFITLSMVDQEIIAYKTATLASGPSYTLGYLRRGGYGSATAAHAVNAPFVRLDENILRIPVDPSQIGQTVYLKFVSFNVFGKGGRTLADETAYTYVVGTNVELPDVPLTPVSFTATGVADGVSLTWTNPNPAAVGCTSIEFATSSGGPWTVLAQVGPTATSFPHHFTTGATYYYRARSRGPLVAAGFSAYTATVSNTGTNVGAISGNATTALGQVTQMPVINGGFDIAPTGYGWAADSGSGWTIDTANNTPGIGPNSAQHAGGAGSGAYRNAGLAACGPDQVYKAQGLIKAVGANGACWVYISWCRADGSEISSTPGNQVTGTTTAGSYATGVAPAGTVYARACLGVASHTAGTYYVDNVLCSQYPSSMDDVPDGSTYFRQTSTGRGVNIMPADWSLFLGTNPPASGNAPNLTLGQDTTAANLLGVAKNLRVTTGATAPTVLYFARVGQFITIKPNSRWIVQMGCRCGTSGMQAEIQMVNASGTPLGRTGVMTLPNSAAGVVSGVLDASAFADTSAQLRLVFSGSWPSGTQLFISYIGLEEQVGASATPSAFSPPVARTMDEQADGSTYGRPLSSRLNAGRPLIDFAEGIHPNKNVDNIADGATYARINGSELSSGTHKLGVPGSGYRLGDMRNQVMVGVGNYGAGWSGGSITYSATTTSATITAAAATLQVGSITLAYNSANVTVSGSAGLVRTYYLYYDDDGYTGGSKTLNATTSQITSLAANGRILVGQVTVTFPTSGTGGGGGGVGCPDENAWVLRADPEGVFADTPVQAKTIRAGHYLRLTDGRSGLVTYSERKPSSRVRVIDENGESLTCSASAPLELFGAAGECVIAPASTGRCVAARAGGVAFGSRVWRVEGAGNGYVQHITCQNACFWTGDDPNYLFSHHNLKPP